MRPALRCILALVAFGLLHPAAAAAQSEAPAEVRTPTATGLEDPGPGLVDRYDPWEGMNRGIHRFNQGFDRSVWTPVMRGYRFVFPGYVRQRFSNFFGNLDQVTIFTNSVMQLDAKKSAGTLGRFLMNSTVGIAGFFDPATKYGLVSYDEDFGQTLGHYGVGPGPYLMLPILGPSSLRDTVGIAVDSATVALIYHFAFGSPFSDHPYLYSIYVLQALQLRDDTPFQFGQLGPFEYDLLRLLYLEHRQLLVSQ